MTKKILSIALATYNMQEYLHRCLKSVLIPEILDAIEIIIVNDGSTDDSLNIAQAYKEQYPESVVLINKQNGHYGSCINAALKAASGTYFRPLDPDDWFDSSALVRFIHKLENTNADLIVTDFVYRYSGNRTRNISLDTKRIIPEHEYQVQSGEYQAGDVRRLLVMHGMTYRTRILHDMAYTQTEGICYTDIEYVFYPLSQITTFLYLPVPLYQYLMDRADQTVAEDMIYRNRNHLYKIIMQILTFLQLNNHTAEKTRILQDMVLHRVLLFYYFCILENHKTPEDENNLHKIDDTLKMLAGDVYNKLSAEKHHKLFRPVALWRNTGRYVGETTLYRIVKSI
ncbi:hypothetical protein FACS189442_2380 [Spirochaetia bacterium]|nr:hypothetical protein FACS189442_2380 [Spirochaetia bacterium]